MKYTLKKYVTILFSGFIPAIAYIMFAFLPFVLMGAVSLMLGGGDFQHTEEVLSTLGDRLMTVIMPVIAIFLLARMWAYIGGILSAKAIPYWAAGLVAAIPSAVLSMIYLAYPSIMANGAFSILYGTLVIYLGVAFTPFFPTWIAFIYVPFIIAIFFMLGWRYCKMKRIRPAALAMAFFGGLHWLFLDLMLQNISPFPLAAQLVCLALTSYFIIKDGFRSKA